MNLKHCVVKAFMIFLRILPVKNNKIVIDNFNGKGYGGSPKYIAQELLKRKEKYQIIWLVEDKNKWSDFPEEIQQVKFLSLRAFYELATAKIWVDNVRKPSFILKRKNQFYVQTWHGGIALKQIEKDVEDALPDSYVLDAKTDSEKVDVILSNCENFSDLVRNSFWYQGEIMEYGLPRNDIFFENHEWVKTKVKDYFGIGNRKIVLYAPTFRKDTPTNVLNAEEILNHLEEKQSGEWNMLIRLHPNEINSGHSIQENDRVRNASTYPDMQELLAAADVLITDYSATMFEFSMMKKPVFLYTYDLESYKKDRNFYFNIEQLPFPLASTEKELLCKISEFNEETYVSEIKRFFDELVLYETGNASRKVVDRIEHERVKGR